MGITSIPIDTHSLVWYIHEASNRKLSRRALEIIQEAELYGTIYVSVITLMEIVDLSEKGRISISFTDVASTIEENEAYQIVPFDEELLKVAIPLKGLEIHDRLILATAILTGSVLVCKDRAIRNQGANVVW